MCVFAHIYCIYKIHAYVNLLNHMYIYIHTYIHIYIYYQPRAEGQ